ncbi:hypothetical protein ROHU_021095 [Labeo rohita]|uniref:Secreted protein n=1 Tax=Labeo rohita TaxID=84645 RepID=A0A498N053_LABRO|nr:hypothetical protein ROHU_021095 [Labeo rohita]
MAVLEASEVVLLVAILELRCLVEAPFLQKTTGSCYEARETGRGRIQGGADGAGAFQGGAGELHGGEDGAEDHHGGADGAGDRQA